jgi:acetylornithine deacetylase/succinyl-diaminopimelate desuccinylase-like protein
MTAKKNALLREAAERVSRHVDDLASITQELVRIPSVNPPGDYGRMAAKMEELYRAEGLEPVVAQAPDDELARLELTAPRPNVIALLEGKSGNPTFCLDAHMDVVDPGEESRWTYAPFGGELHEGRIYGRGAADTKAHLAMQLIVVRVLREMGLELSGNLIVSSTVDDEIGAWPGIGFLLDQGFEANGFPRPDYHIAGEPTGVSLCACLARGRVWYEITLRGSSAHGGNPKKGVNAIEKAMTLAEAVKAFPVQENPLMGVDTINIGRISGGEAINVVPSSCLITFDIRPTVEREVVHSYVEGAIKRLEESDPDFIVESLRMLNNRQTGGIGPDHAFVQTIQNVVRELTGKSVEPTGDLGGYSALGNAYWSTQAGIAGVMYGAGAFDRAHSVDEFISVDELAEMCKVFLGVVIETCA